MWFKRKTDKQSNTSDSDLRIFGIHLTKNPSTGIIKSCFLNGIFTKEQKKLPRKSFIDKKWEEKTLVKVKMKNFETHINEFQ